MSAAAAVECRRLGGRARHEAAGAVPDNRGGALVPALARPGLPRSARGGPFPTALDPFVCTRYEIVDVAREASALGVRFLGVCCGAGPHHIRAMAEALGRTPPAGRYSADMSKHAFLGTDPGLKAENRAFAGEL